MKRIPYNLIKQIGKTQSNAQFSSFSVTRNVNATTQNIVEKLTPDQYVPAFLHASGEGNLKVVQQLLEKEKSLINKGDYDLRTALHLAAAEGQFEVVKFLVQNGADVNVVDRWNRTPLEDSLRGKHQEITDYLISKGAKSHMPFDEVANNLCAAAADEDIEQLDILLKSGANINAGDYDGRTALHLACAAGSQEVVEFLLENGADINVSDNFGVTPILDAMKNKHTSLVRYLAAKGATLPSEVNHIIDLPEFTASVNKALEVLCIDYDWDYGEAWIPHRNNKYLKYSKAFYAKESYEPILNNIRSSVTSLRFQKDQNLPGKVWASKAPVFVEYLTSNDVPNANIIKAESALAIPVVYDGKVLTVLILYSKTKKNIDTTQLDYLVSYVNRLTTASVPTIEPKYLDYQLKGKFVEKMNQVFEYVKQKGVFDYNLLYYETHRYFFDLGLPEEYFNHFTAEEIGTHVHSLIAAKKVGQGTTGRQDDIWLVNETEEGAYYMCPRDRKIINQLEPRIDEYIKKTPKTHGYRVEYFASKNPIVVNGDWALSIYVVKRTPWDHQQITNNDELSLDAVSNKDFRIGRKKESIERYEKIIKKAADRLYPVLEKFEKDENGLTPVMLAFQNLTDDSYLSRISELIQSIKGMRSAQKYAQSFSNGLVVYSLYVHSEKDEDIDVLLNKASLISMIPRTELFELFKQRKLTVRELMYAYSVSKFCYYFSTQQSDEYKMLVQALQNDNVNLARLLRLQNRLRKDALTENRIADCIADNVELVVNELYEDFVEIATGKKNPEFNHQLYKKIKRTVTDPMDAVILESFLVFNAHLRKTNFFKTEKAAISYRFDTGFLDASYPEKPYSIFLLIGNDFTGFHVRFSDVARGGIRAIRSANETAYNANAEDLFTENYNLAYTQQSKNKDIPEGGSKGTILLAPEHQQNVVIAFKKYVDAILDLLLPTKEVYDHLGKPEILFLGPDEGTAGVMDWAALHAKARGASFWKAFTTGKSTSLGGIPHDVYGMTTTSVHEYVLGILRELNIKEEEITKVQTGGPDGDLGGNEILISKDKTLAVVDGSGVLYDPEGLNRQELVRLVREHKMISGYDTSLLSKQGYRVLVTENEVTLPDGHFVENGMNFRNQFHLNPHFKADLFVPCGGRPASINISNVNKFFDKNGKPKVKWIVEGANLFLTQDARLVLEKAGVILYKDASANKGGVTSSSLEVLAALSFSNEEFEEHMQVKDGVIPEFYKIYVEEVKEKIRSNARGEFQCIWNEHKRTGTPRAILTDLLSAKINKLNDAIQNSNLWEDKEFVRKVMINALPKTLQQKLGLETIMKRVPENYLKAIFGAHLASSYVYKYGLDASEFEFFEFMKTYGQQEQ